MWVAVGGSLADDLVERVADRAVAIGGDSISGAGLGRDLPARDHRRPGGCRYEQCGCGDCCCDCGSHLSRTVAFFVVALPAASFTTSTSFSFAFFFLASFFFAFFVNLRTNLFLPTFLIFSEPLANRPPSVARAEPSSFVEKVRM